MCLCSSAAQIFRDLAGAGRDGDGPPPAFVPAAAPKQDGRRKGEPPRSPRHPPIPLASRACAPCCTAGTGRVKERKRLSGYQLFSNAERPGLKEARPDATFGEVSSAIGAMWAQMPPEEKAAWLAKAKALPSPDEDGFAEAAAAAAAEGAGARATPSPLKPAEAQPNAAAPPSVPTPLSSDRRPSRISAARRKRASRRPGDS